MSNGARGVQTDFRHLRAAGAADSEHNGHVLEEARAAADAARLLCCAKEWVVAALEQGEHGGAARGKVELGPYATWIEYGANDEGRKERDGEGRDKGGEEDEADETDTWGYGAKRWGRTWTEKARTSDREGACWQRLLA